MKKLLSWSLLLAMLVAMLSGCGQQAASSTTEEASTQEAAEVSVSEAAPAEEPAVEPETTPEQSAEESIVEEEAAPAEFVEVELPIVTEPTSFSIWYTWPSVLTNFVDGPGSTPFAEELENRTGVHIEYKLINTESADEEFALMVASGDYTDMILSATNYYTNPDQIIEDGVAIDVAPYLDDLMPNLKAVLDSNQEYKLAAYTDNGCIPECYRFEIGTEQNVGPVIRKDWLDKLGLDIPTTYDDYYEVLSAFKTEMDCAAPLLIPYTGLTNYFSLGYGVPCELGTGLFYVVDGQVKYAGLEQDYYDYLELMTKWYADGLIDQDFLTRTTTTDPDTGLISSGDAGVWTANALMFDTYSDMVDDPDFAITGTAYPKKSEDAPMMYTSEDKVTGGGYAVTTDCHDVETCLRWIDYWYSKEGTQLANYGIEGISFEYDENGEPHLNETILQSDMGLPSSLTLSMYVTNGGPYVNDCNRTQYYFGDLQRSALETWDRSNETFCSEGFPASAGLTTEEAETYSSIMSDIETYMEETVSSILVGNAPISTLDDMAKNLKSMNIDGALELMQGAYDRYMAKAE
jgi:putative aldouronate transport system substrate-binding protein